MIYLFAGRQLDQFYGNFYDIFAWRIFMNYLIIVAKPNLFPPSLFFPIKYGTNENKNTTNIKIQQFIITQHVQWTRRTMLPNLRSLLSIQITRQIRNNLCGELCRTIYQNDTKGGIAICRAPGYAAEESGGCCWELGGDEIGRSREK